MPLFPTKSPAQNAGSAQRSSVVCTAHPTSSTPMVEDAKQIPSVPARSQRRSRVTARSSAVSCAARSSGVDSRVRRYPRAQES
jgi:hypothetical protein